MTVYTFALTGHRPNKLGGYDLKNPKYRTLYTRLLQIIEQALTTHEKVRCHSGMALGADTVWAYAIVMAKKQYGACVEFIADIPCPSQDCRWRELDQKRYAYLLRFADQKIIYAKTYSPACMMTRNKGMVDDCDELIAVYNGDQTGGTANAVHYAQKLNKLITVIDPREIF